MATPHGADSSQRDAQLRAHIEELDEENRRTKAELNELRQLYMNAPVGLCLTDLNNRFVRINERLAAINGQSVEDHIGASLREILPEIADMIEPQHHQVMEKGKPLLDLEMTGVTSANPTTERSYLVNYHPAHDESGRLIGVNTVVQDITDLKHTEQRLLEFGRLLENSLDEIYLFDAESLRFVLVNRGARKNLGYSMDELRELTPLDLKPDFSPEGFAELLRPLRSGAEQLVEFETNHRRKDGSLYPVEVQLQLSRFQGAPVFIAMILDTTERIRAEHDPKVSESRFRSYFNLGLVGMAVTSPVKDWVLVNEKLCETLGFPRDELTRKTWAELTHPDDLAADLRQFDRVLAGEIDGYSMEKRFIHKNGDVIDASIDVQCTRNEDHSVDQFVALIQDISDRKRAEKSLQRAHDELERRVEQRTRALHESEQRFRTIFEQAAVGMALLETSTGQFVRSNQMYCNLVGYSHEEITQKTFQQLTHPDDLQEDLDNMERLVRGEIREFTMEKRYFRKNGSLVWVSLTVSATWEPGEEPRHHIAIIEDISERKQVEAQLQTEQKLLRRLIDLQEEERRMVAHDIHDGFVQDVVGAHLKVQSINRTRDPDANESTAKRVGSLLKKAIAEGRRLIQNLRPMVLDEEGIVEAVRHLIADERVHAGLVVAFSHDVRFDRLDPRLEGVIFRIIQEALTNIKRHGQTDHAAVELNQRDGLLEVVVRDRGVGFDPSKVTLKSFGLRGICERARLFGGTAKIESTPGDGTTVCAQLPIDG